MKKIIYSILVCCILAYLSVRELLLHGVKGLQKSWRPFPKVHSGAFSGQTGMEDTKRTRRRCSASVCLAGVDGWDLVGVRRSTECNFVCPSCLILGLSSVFILPYHHLLGTSYYIISEWFSACSGLVISTCQVIG